MKKLHLSRKASWNIFADGTNNRINATFAACGTFFGKTTPNVKKVTCGNCKKIIQKVRKQFCES